MNAHFDSDAPAYMQHVDPVLLVEAIATRFGIDQNVIKGFGTSDEDAEGNVQIDMHLQLYITQLELNKIYDACWKERNG